MVLLALLMPFLTRAQTDRDVLDNLLVQDSVDMNTLAGYPETSRNAALEMAAHPESITRLHDLRRNSNENFKNALSALSQYEQQRIYNLARYDGLIAALVKGGKKTTPQVKEILKSYPADAANDAIYCNEQYHNLLVTIQTQNENFSASYNEVVGGFPPATQNAIRELMNQPEVISLLAGNMPMTVRLGDLYARNPELVKQKLAERNLELARQRALDAEEWKASIKNNPGASAELQDAAKEYARDQGYSSSEYQETDPVIIEHYHYVPYPYWCGYPWWYENPYWYPYPYWYHWGFYYWHGEMVWTGYPSWYFMYWHFHNPHHFYHYPHLSDAYITHYYGPRRSSAANTRIVQKWADENRGRFTTGFLKNDGKRAERLQEYGKMEMAVEKIQKENPARNIDRNTYIRENKKEYPALQPVIRSQPQTGPGVKQPAVPDRKVKEPVRQNQPPPVKKQEPGKTEPGTNAPVRKQEPAPSKPRQEAKPAVKEPRKQ